MSRPTNGSLAIMGLITSAGAGFLAGRCIKVAVDSNVIAFPAVNNGHQPDSADPGVSLVTLTDIEFANAFLALPPDSQYRPGTIGLFTPDSVAGVTVKAMVVKAVNVTFAVGETNPFTGHTIGPQEDPETITLVTVVTLKMCNQVPSLVDGGMYFTFCPQQAFPNPFVPDGDGVGLVLNFA